MESRPQAMVEDVINFINNKVDELVAIGMCTTLFATDLKQSLHQLADNSFLWASVVLKQCRISLELSPESLPQLLSVVPMDLKEAYARYLPKVPHQSLTLLQKYTQFLVACKRPLKLEEIAICMVAGNCHSINDIRRTQNAAIESSLQRAFGPLLRISQNQTFFAHTAVSDYLADISADKSHPLHDSHGVEMRAAYLTFAVACMKYLFLEDFWDDLFDIQDPKTDRSLSSSEVNGLDEISLDIVDDIADLFGIHDVTFVKDEHSIREISAAQVEAQFEFYEYAATNWTYHYACSEDLVPEEVVKQTNQAFENRINSLCKLVQLCRGSVQNINAGAFTIRLSAIFWAASKGCAEAVRILIEHDIDPNKTQNGQTALAIAVQAGYFAVCTTLLKYSGTDPNLTERRGCAPLSLAAAYNHRDILGVLLAHERIEINRVDALGRTAFTEASINGSLDCLQDLLHDGWSFLNHQDSKGQNALIHAVRNEFYAISRLLLKSPSPRLDLVDVRRRNAMSHATEDGDLRIVQQLWHRKISISSQDCDGRNAISWAANSASATNTDHDRRCALKFLIESSRKSVDVVGHYGWTPLAWAMDPPGHLKAVEILIEDGQVNVNQCDETRGRPVLSWAANEDFLEITKFLLKTIGIEKNRIDHDGRTPLSCAAGSGRLDVVNLVALDTRDSLGRTVLDWAMLGQHDSVVQKLQHYLEIRSC